MTALRKRRFTTAAIVVATFGAGFVTARLLPENFAAHAQTTPAMMNEIIMPGPAFCAASAVRTKMPVPITAPMPSMVS